MKLRLLEEADVEFGAIAQWYEDQRAGLGERFISEALDAFIAIERNPHRYPQHRFRSTRDLRSASLKHFPHSIIYEIEASECVVVAIAHPSRRPAYWRKRLE